MSPRIPHYNSHDEVHPSNSSNRHSENPAQHSYVPVTRLPHTHVRHRLGLAHSSLSETVVVPYTQFYATRAAGDREV